MKSRVRNNNTYTGHIAENGVDLSRIDNGVAVVYTVTCNVAQGPGGLLNQFGIRAVKQAKQIRNGVGIDGHGSLKCNTRP